MNIKCNYKGNFPLPKKQTEFSAGLDLFNNNEFPVEIAPHKSVIIDTGFFVEIPDGYVGLLFARSSLGFKLDCTLANSVGVIDSDYRGEVKAKIINHSDNTVTIQPNERVVQLVIVPILNCDFNYTDKLSDTERGEGGFGSTGKI